MIEPSLARILLFVAALAAAATMPLDTASAKRLSQCTYHDMRNGISPVSPDMAPGPDGKSVIFYPGTSRHGPPRPPGYVKKIRCVVHLDCAVPKNVRNVEFRYKANNKNVNYRPLLLRGQTQPPPIFRMVSSTVEPGFPVRFKDASGALIKTCKIVVITDN
jgi:hypothetical protein